MVATTIRLSGAALAGAVVLATMAISGCGGSSNDSGGSANTPPPPAAVDEKMIPASAGASGPAFVSYVRTLPADEVTAEPKGFAQGFSDPAEDGEEPVPAS